MSEFNTSMKQNYGGMWVNNIEIALQLNCRGLKTVELLQLFNALHILPDKAKDLMRQQQELGYLRLIDNLWYYEKLEHNFILPREIYVDEKNKKNESTEDTIKRERKEKMISPDVKEEKKTPKLETMAELKARRFIEYQEYRKHTEALKREPKIYEDWLTEKNRIEEFEEQKRLKKLENKES